MVEVFKTNIENSRQAGLVLYIIHRKFREYKANVDLDDCDRILRVESSGRIQATLLIQVVQALGFHAEVLPDEPGTETGWTMDELLSMR